MTTDVDAAKTFYSELLGWMLLDMDVGSASYAGGKAGETEVASIMYGYFRRNRGAASLGVYIRLS